MYWSNKLLGHREICAHSYTVSVCVCLCSFVRRMQREDLSETQLQVRLTHCIAFVWNVGMIPLSCYVYLCMCVYTYVRIYVSMCVYVCMFVVMVCMAAVMYVCMYE